ncbi:MAG: hypothetical protein ACPGGE_01640 [Poseidonia sp.]
MAASDETEVFVSLEDDSPVEQPKKVEAKKTVKEESKPAADISSLVDQWDDE